MQVSLGRLKYADVPLVFDLNKPRRTGNILYVGSYLSAVNFYRKLIEPIPPGEADYYLTVWQEKRKAEWEWLYRKGVTTIQTVEELEEKLPGNSRLDFEEADKEVFPDARPVFYIVDDLWLHQQNKLANRVKMFSFMVNSLHILYAAADPFTVNPLDFQLWGKPLAETTEDFGLSYKFNLWVFAPFEETNEFHETIAFGAIVPSMLRENERLVWLNGQWDVLLEEQVCP